MEADGEREEAFRRTKIVATVGPATSAVDRLAELISAGADVLRINFSHATADEHADRIATIREASERAEKVVGLLGDLPGPKLRLGDVPGDVVELDEGDELTLCAEATEGSAERLTVSWAGLPGAVKEGDVIYLADGRIRLRVLDADADEARCEIEAGGPVASHQGINLPGADASLPAVSETDLEWVDFAVEQDLDLIAVSFVRTRDDLRPVEERLASHGVDTPIIAKIEKPQAADNAEEIVEAATGIMVARGDLGIELPLAKVPTVQKRLLALAGHHSKFSITATQMLASMVTAPRPTRAEVTDVANAIYDGTDAVMLSEETAVGEYPVEAVRVMDRIARETEPNLPYGEWLLSRGQETEGDVGGTVAQGAVGATYRLGLAALVVPTRSGRTARLVSAHRPRVPVLAISPRPETVRRLNVLFGVRCVPSEEWASLRDLLDDCARLAREQGVAASGDLIAITAGLPEQKLGTNLFEVHRVP
ncbi:MAG TPA: pyruvate kinase [Solirubrobacterales bacterium]|nr:pyruvate kinase [Solirubrobacterales bacterium]